MNSTGKSEKDIRDAYKNLLNSKPALFRKVLEKQFGNLKEDSAPTSVAPSTTQNGIHASKAGDMGRRVEPGENISGKFKKFVNKRKKI